MNVQYRELCRIAFKHSYYADGNLKEFNLNPTSETQNKMRRDILHKQTKNGVILVANPTKSINSTDLHFSLNLQNPYFLTFNIVLLKETFP